MSQRERDFGWRRIRAAFTALPRGYTKVGLQTGDQHTDPEGAQTSQAQIGAYHEFGTESIPRRPFMSATLEAKRRDLHDFKQRLLTNVFQGSLGVRQALGLLGQRHEDQVKAAIRKGPWEPNAPATIAAKGSSRPLIDTGQMVQAIRHVEVIE